MSKSLIIAEKPSVASDLARALGGFKKQDDYFENDRYIISSARRPSGRTLPAQRAGRQTRQVELR